MQEIIPMLEGRWLASAQPGEHEVRVVQVDDTPISTYFADLLRADNIVFICFTYKIARIGELLRRDARSDARYFVYLHNQATIACWPFHACGMGGLLRTTDVFLASCEFDAEALRQSFVSASVETIPFTLPDAETFLSRHSRLTPSVKGASFVFIGRISAQKNLHTLLVALRKLIDLEPNDEATKLMIYGGEDNLDSPNMGMRRSGYLNELMGLARTLKLETRVSFAGHLQRDELHARLAVENFVLVSPSLHSDENFGMAAFRSLCLGRSAVLTRWGGHAEYARHFMDQVFEVPVHGGESGPWISAAEFAMAMSEARKRANANCRPVANIPDAFSPERISQRIHELATSPVAASQALEIAATAREVLIKQKEFSRDNENDPCRIFESYRDPLAVAFFKAYGMRGREIEPRVQSVAYLVPWARICGEEILIQDPHRGEFVLSATSPNLAPRMYAVKDGEGKSIKVSEAIMHELLRGGFAEYERDGSATCPAS
jgi:glycosyltransferase involved in cell wall biosynthesis